MMWEGKKLSFGMGRGNPKELIPCSIGTVPVPLCDVQRIKKMYSIFKNMYVQHTWNTQGTVIISQIPYLLYLHARVLDTDLDPYGSAFNLAPGSESVFNFPANLRIFPFFSKIIVCSLPLYYKKMKKDIFVKAANTVSRAEKSANLNSVKICGVLLDVYGKIWSAWSKPLSGLLTIIYSYLESQKLCYREASIREPNQHSTGTLDPDQHRNFGARSGSVWNESGYETLLHAVTSFIICQKHIGT